MDRKLSLKKPGGKTALVLCAHGSREKSWTRSAAKLARESKKLLPGTDVRIAYLGHAKPSLPQAAKAAFAGGAGRLVILPLFVAAGAHVRRDLRKLAAEIRRDFPGRAVALLPVLGAMPGLAGFIASAAKKRV